MTLVLDASAALGWSLDEKRGAVLQPVLDRVIAKGAFVPSLWHLEVANGLTMAVRSGHLTSEGRDATIQDLATLDIEIDDLTEAEAWKATIRLADLYGLTAYDAAYLELAQRLRLPLATLDRALAKAGRAAGVEILPA